MPKGWSPARYSPESLTTTRRYFASAIARPLSLTRSEPRLARRLLLLAAGGRNFGGEVRFLLLDSLAQSIAHVTGDFHRTTDLALSFLQRLADALLVVEDEGLLQQRLLLVEGLQARLGDLLDHRLGLALLTELVGQDVLLALDHRRIDTRRVN